MALAERIGEFGGRNCLLELWRAAPALVLIRITGRDVGESGDAPLRALEKELQQNPIELFIDARNSKGASLEVSNAWACWLRSYRSRLRSIHMLTGSRFIRLTADVVRRFADLGDIMFIYTEGAAFDERLDEVRRRANVNLHDGAPVYGAKD